MIGVGDAAFAEAFAGMASAGEKPAARALSPLRPGRAVKLAADAASGANGVLTASVRLAIAPVNADGPK